MKWACGSLKDILMEILSTRLKRRRGVWEDRPAAWVGVSRRGQTSLSLQSLVFVVFGWVLRSRGGSREAPGRKTSSKVNYPRESGDGIPSLLQTDPRILREWPGKKPGHRGVASVLLLS